MNRHNLRNDLLMQDGITPDVLPNDTRKEIVIMMTREQQRVRRMKWSTIISLCVLVILFVTGALFKNSHDLYAKSVAVICMGLFWITVIFLISWYVRYITLKFQKVNFALEKIQEQLTDIQNETQETTA